LGVIGHAEARKKHSGNKQNTRAAAERGAFRGDPSTKRAVHLMKRYGCDRVEDVLNKPNPPQFCVSSMSFAEDMVQYLLSFVTTLVQG
jgi:hypothetical protein